jgi:iron complex outermembrane receptor protein
MLYKDQLVLTGELNDVGEPIRTNVDDSYRIGVELDGGLKISNQLFWNATAALSDNRIKNFTEVVYLYDAAFDPIGQQNNEYRNTKIAYSPSLITSSELGFRPFKNAEIALLSKYISKQYLDNTRNSDSSLPAFDVHDLRFRYNTSFRDLKNIGFTFLVNNVFSEKYSSNGYTFSYVYDSDFTTENFYYPQAYRNFLLGVSLKF